jgi:hypothetical protein
LVAGDFFCHGCTSLTSLEGAPSLVAGDFFCYGCTSLTSLEGAPSSVSGSFSCYGCTSLRKPILRLLKIKKLKKIIYDNADVQAIVNGHMQDKNIAACQTELMKNGFKEYAKL